MISELLAYDFMQRAILAVIAISIFSPILGLFLILRRQSLMSDTLSHVSLAGVAVGIFLGQSTTWMTLVVVVIAALVLEYLRVSYKHYMEISTAILMSMGLAVALILSDKVFSPVGALSLDLLSALDRGTDGQGFSTVCDFVSPVSVVVRIVAGACQPYSFQFAFTPLRICMAAD